MDNHLCTFYNHQVYKHVAKVFPFYYYDRKICVKFHKRGSVDTDEPK